MADDVRPPLIKWADGLLTRYGGLTSDPDCCCTCPAGICATQLFDPLHPWPTATIDDLRPYWPGYDGGSGPDGGWKYWKLIASGFSWCCPSAIPPYTEEELIYQGINYYEACRGSVDTQALEDAIGDYWIAIGRSAFELNAFTVECLTEAELDGRAASLAKQADSAGEYGAFKWRFRIPKRECLCNEVQIT